jgi:hypothetical protein
VGYQMSTCNEICKTHGLLVKWMCRVMTQYRCVEMYGVLEKSDIQPCQVRYLQHQLENKKKS